MSILLSPAPTAAPAPPAPVVPSVPRAHLVIGAADIAAKDRMVLQSLVRLLDHHDGLQLRFGEQIDECNVLFVPDDWPRRVDIGRIPIHLTPPGAPADASRVPAAGLRVGSPLRMSAVMAALTAAAELLRSAPESRPATGSNALFQSLVGLTSARERRITTVPFADGRGMVVVDVPNERLASTLPLEQLIAACPAIGAAHRSTNDQAKLLDTGTSENLRTFMWAAASCLQGQGPAPHGRYRLLRWPDSAALAAPGAPRLVAAWTRRTMSIDEAAAGTAVPRPAVAGFMAVCLAFGLAEPVDETPPAPGTPPSIPPSAAAPAAAGLFARLRERLKLW